MSGAGKKLTAMGSWPGLKLEGAEISGLVNRKRSLLTGRVTVSTLVNISAGKQPLDLAIITENLVSKLKDFIPLSRAGDGGVAENLRGAEQGKHGRGIEEELFYAAGLVLQTELGSVVSNEASDEILSGVGLPGLDTREAVACDRERAGCARFGYS